MIAVYSPKYKVYYRVNPRDGEELQWVEKVTGPSTQWQHAYSFNRPIKALDVDDDTGACVVILNDGSTHMAQSTRAFARKFYASGSRIYDLYKI